MPSRHPSAANLAPTWVRQADVLKSVAKASIFTARLTIDVTRALRGRIKMIALQRGFTAAELPEREYGGGQS